LACGRPDEVQIEIEVGVDEPVAHPDHVLPGDVRVGVTQFRGEPRGRFSDDLDTADDRMLKRALRIELFPRQPLHILCRLASGLEHVTDAGMVGIKQHIE